METSPLTRRQALVIGVLPLLLIACTLVNWWVPSPASSEIELTNEAVLATNRAIQSAILATETAEARQSAIEEETDTARPKLTHTPTSAPIATPKGVAPLTNTPTPDPCTGWPCLVRGAVYAGEVNPGQALEGASVRLEQFSYCSPTRGEQETVTGPDGRFEFSEIFFHDTDRVWIEVEAEGFEGARWDSVAFDCLFCGCFGSPIEFVLQTAPGR